MMGMRSGLGILGIILVAVLAFGILAAGCAQAPPKENKTNVTTPPPMPQPPANVTPPYEPKINPAEFTSKITNRYFTLTPGKKMVYKAQTEDGIETTEVYVLNETKMVYGVETAVVWDRVWLDDELIEDTKDWYAQNTKTGDVWYFGEDTKELRDGKVVTTHGSWEAGVDGGRPGVIMRGNPVIGDSYRQEYYAGVVEDSGRIVSLTEAVSVPFGNFTGCVKTFDWTPIEPNVTENKYYCPGVGGVALEVDIEDNERVELTEVEYNSQPSSSVKGYDPKINPADFTTSITNKYFALVPGKKMSYESETEDGTETVEIYVTNQTRTVMGVKTVVVWDRVWLDGSLIEDTMDYYAQNAKTGDVWYFGEDTKEMAGGVVTTTSGSWEAGVDGAKPGIIAEANPKVGDSYRQEYYAGEAEDMADVLALNETVSVPFGSFSGCLKTRDWTPLEPGADEHKYYCTSVGGVVLEVVVEDGEREELTGVEYDSQPSPSVENPPPAETNITEGQAEQIALGRVPGTVTDIAIEMKFGKLCYVVEVDPVSGPETDVIIDIKTGEVLAVET